MQSSGEPETPRDSALGGAMTKKPTKAEIKRFEEMLLQDDEQFT
jgi:hypothetical protein